MDIIAAKEIGLAVRPLLAKISSGYEYEETTNITFFVISFCFSTSAYAYLDVATFDGNILYIPTVRIGESILYDVELSYAEGTVFNFQNQDIPLSRVHQLLVPTQRQKGS